MGRLNGYLVLAVRASRCVGLYPVPVQETSIAYPVRTEKNLMYDIACTNSVFIHVISVRGSTKRVLI